MPNKQGFQTWAKNLFFHNFLWKIFSLLLAVAVYFWVLSYVSDVRTVSLAVEIGEEARDELAAAGVAVTTIEPPSVQVKLRGSSREISNFDPAGACLLLRPPIKSALENFLWETKLGKSSLHGVASGLSVLNIEPEQARVTFDDSMELRLAIAPVIVEGKAKGRVELDPQLSGAIVHGSRRSLRALDPLKAEIGTEPIDVEGRFGNFTVPVKLLPPADVPNATVKPPVMNVAVKVVSETAKRKLEHEPILPVKPANSSVRWRVEPDFADCELTGRNAVLNDIQPGQVLLTVDANRPVTSDTRVFDVPVRVHVLHGLQVDSVSAMPSTVRLIAEEAQESVEK